MLATRQTILDRGMTIIDPPPSNPPPSTFHPAPSTRRVLRFTFAIPYPPLLVRLVPSRAAGNFMLELTGSMETATKVFEDPRSGRWRVIFHHLGLGEQHLPPPFPPSRGRLIFERRFRKVSEMAFTGQKKEGRRGNVFLSRRRQELGVPGTNARQIFLRRLPVEVGKGGVEGEGKEERVLHSGRVFSDVKI